MEEGDCALSDPQLMALAGAIKALEYGVRALIATHPDPEGFARAWQALLPEIAEAHVNIASETPAFRDGMQSVLSRLTRQAGLAAQQHQEPLG